MTDDNNYVTFRAGVAIMLGMSGFPREGHTEVVPLTDEDRAEHARAVQAYEEIMSNPWIELYGSDYELNVTPLEPRKKFVPDETEEEHLARWVAAGRPMRNVFQEVLERQRAAMIRSIDQTILGNETQLETSEGAE